MQLDWFSKRQTATAHSTSESKLIALPKLLRECLVPQIGLWSILLQRQVSGRVYEDNTATIKMVEVGYSQQMRHLAKHHRISLGLAHEFFKHKDLHLEHIPTDQQKGNLFTKGLSPQKHVDAMKLVRLFGGVMLVLRRRKGNKNKANVPMSVEGGCYIVR